MHISSIKSMEQDPAYTYSNACETNRMSRIVRESRTIEGCTILTGFRPPQRTLGVLCTQLPASSSFVPPVSPYW